MWESAYSKQWEVSDFGSDRLAGRTWHLIPIPVALRAQFMLMFAWTGGMKPALIFLTAVLAAAQAAEGRTALIGQLGHLAACGPSDTMLLTAKLCYLLVYLY